MFNTVLLRQWTKPTVYFCAFFAAWLVLVGGLWREPALLTLILAVIALIYFAFLRERNGLLFFAVAAFFGPIGEGTVSATGLWTYYGATVLGIPYWLPLAWGITAVAIHKYLETVARRARDPESKELPDA